MSLLEEGGFGTEVEICSDVGYSALLVNAEMLLVGTELWRTTVTWSKASAWSELTTVDMFTFLHGLPSLREWGGMKAFFFFFLPIFLNLFIYILFRGQPIIVKMKELKGH